jgi:hypothetical protein
MPGPCSDGRPVIDTSGSRDRGCELKQFPPVLVKSDAIGQFVDHVQTVTHLSKAQANERVVKQSNDKAKNNAGRATIDWALTVSMTARLRSSRRLSLNVAIGRML